MHGRIDRIEQIAAPIEIIDDAVPVDLLKALEAEVQETVDVALAAARARPAPTGEGVAQFVYADPSPDVPDAFGGLSRAERDALHGTDTPSEDGDKLRFAEAVRRIGAERVMFASDGPGCSPKIDLEKIRVAGLSPADEALVMGLNAKKLIDGVVA